MSFIKIYLKLFSDIFSKKHVFLVFDHMGGLYFQIDSNFIVLLLIVVLFSIRNWYYKLILSNWYSLTGIFRNYF